MKRIFLIAAFCTGILSITKEEFVEKMNFYDKNLDRSKEIGKKNEDEISENEIYKKVRSVLLSLKKDFEKLIEEDQLTTPFFFEILKKFRSEEIVAKEIKSLLKKGKINEEDIENRIYLEILNDFFSQAQIIENENKSLLKKYEESKKLFDALVNLCHQWLEEKIGENTIAKIISNSQNFINKQDPLFSNSQNFSNTFENMRTQNRYKNVYDGIELAEDIVNGKTKIEFPKKQSSKTKYIIGGVIVAAIVGVGIYYYYNLKK